MKENIARRVSRIVSSSVNALVDAIESAAPHMVMEQAIREIDGVIDEVRVELGAGLAQKHLAEQRLAAHRERHDELGKHAKLALQEKREDLAEVAIEQQMNIEDQLPVLEAAITEASAKEAELEGYIKALQAKKREMKEELKKLQTLQQSAAAPEDADPAVKQQGNYAAKAEKASSAFDRILEKQSGLSAPSVQLDNAAKLDELEALARKTQIRERLADLKADKD